MKNINKTFEKIIQEIEFIFLKENLNDFELKNKNTSEHEILNINELEYSYSIKKLNMVFYINIYMNWSSTISSYTSGKISTESIFNLTSSASLNIITTDIKSINQILRRLRIFIKKISLLKEISDNV